MDKELPRADKAEDNKAVVNAPADLLQAEPLPDHPGAARAAKLQKIPKPEALPAFRLFWWAALFNCCPIPTTIKVFRHSRPSLPNRSTLHTPHSTLHTPDSGLRTQEASRVNGEPSSAPHFTLLHHRFKNRARENFSHCAGINEYLESLTQRMLRKGTALIMLWLMMVVVATSQPGLSYCLCLQEVFVGGCECPEPDHKNACSAESGEGSCNCGSQDTEIVAEDSLLPCQNCSLSLHMEFDHFLANDSVQTPGHEGTVHLFPPGQSGEIDTVSPLISSIHGIRGSPPPIPGLIPSVSLRLKYSVFLV